MGLAGNSAKPKEESRMKGLVQTFCGAKTGPEIVQIKSKRNGYTKIENNITNILIQTKAVPELLGQPLVLQNGRHARTSGEVKPSIDVATKIAEALRVSLDYLVGFAEQELDQA